MPPASLRHRWLIVAVAPHVAACALAVGADFDRAGRPADDGGAGTPEGDAGANPGGWTTETATCTGLPDAIWGSGPNSIYIAGSEGIYYSAGDGQWRLQTPSFGANAIW